MCGILFCVLAAVAFMKTIHGEKWWIIIATVFAVFTIISIKAFIRQVQIVTHTIDLVAETEHALDCVDEEQITLLASLARLSKAEYLDYLVDNDIEVPNYFYRRIHYTPAERYVEKHAKKAEKDNSELEELLEKQKRYRTAQAFLSKGVHNRNFKNVAEEMHMSPAEFKKYCDNIVENYENLHREYNQTHTIPAPMLNDDE